MEISEETWKKLESLYPGDVLVFPPVDDWPPLKSLVLARAIGGGVYLTLLGEGKIVLANDSDGPFFPNRKAQALVSVDGGVFHNIEAGFEVAVEKGGGLTEFHWFHEIPTKSQLRFEPRFEPVLDQLFESEPKLSAQIEGIARSNDVPSTKLALALDFILGEDKGVIDERRFCLLALAMTTIMEYALDPFDATFAAGIESKGPTSAQTFGDDDTRL